MTDLIYLKIAEKIEKNPLRAPKTGDGFPDAFIAYLKLLYSPEEAGLVAHLNMPMDFTSTEQLAEITGKNINDTAAILDRLHKKNALIGMGNLYCLPPIPMLINVHQFYSDTKPDDIEAARLQRAFFINHGYYRYYEASEKGTPVFRAIPVEEAISDDQQVLSSEEAHEFIMNLKTEDLALVPCPCRTRMEKLGIRECKDKYPIGSCIMLGMSALHFESLGLGKRVTKEFWITTSRPVKGMADRMGYTNVIEAAGAKFATDTCCVVAPIKGRFNALATDSAKACYYAYAKNNFKTRLLPFDDVIKVAIQ